jgi:putative hydrolase of the HAD superfamily
MILGLISNAQFFTPLLFEAFFGAPPEGLGFDAELLAYSYKLGEAKPSPALFAPATRRLAALGLKPENALYIGNDMLNDIFAAARAGFKTALFAGDPRSLRLREEDPRIRGLMPDRVVRGLGEVAGVIAWE